MRLRLRRHKPEPVVDRSDEWAEVLRRFKTRSSPELQRTLYHRLARQRREAVVAVREMLHPTTPPEKTAARISQQFSSPRQTFSETSPPPEPSANPWETPPDFDDSQAGLLRRRYGEPVCEPAKWPYC